MQIKESSDDFHRIIYKVVGILPEVKGFGITIL